MPISVFLQTGTNQTISKTALPLAIVTGITGDYFEYAFVSNQAARSTTPPAEPQWTRRIGLTDSETVLTLPDPGLQTPSGPLAEGGVQLWVRQFTSSGLVESDTAFFQYDATPPVLPLSSEILLSTSAFTTISVENWDGSNNLPNLSIGNLSGNDPLYAYVSLPFIADLDKVELRVGESVIGTARVSPGDAWVVFNLTEGFATRTPQEKASLLMALFIGDDVAAVTSATLNQSVTLTALDAAGNSSNVSTRIVKSGNLNTSSSNSPASSLPSAPGMDNPQNQLDVLLKQNPVIMGSVSNDKVLSIAGAQTVDGGQGQDIWIASKSIISYSTIANTGINVLRLVDTVAGGDGNDQISNFELVQFPGTTVGSFDLYTTTLNAKANLRPLVQAGVGGDLFGGKADYGSTTTPVILVGAAGSQRLTGGTGNDTLSGGKGNDTIDGGAGNDLVKFDGDIGQYSIAFTAAIAVGGTSLAAAYTITNNTDGSVKRVQNTEFFQFGDKFYTLSTVANPVATLTGSVLQTTRGQTSTGTANNEVFRFTEGQVTINGVSGDDTVLFANPASSYVLSGEGSALRVSSGAGSALLQNVDYINFADTTYTFSVAATPSLSQVARYQSGGAGNDTVDGSTATTRQILDGGAGNDSLRGGLGDDILNGGTGNDTLSGGLGLDTAVFDGPASNYSLTYNTSDKSYTVTSTANGTDRLSGIEYLRFSDSTKTLVNNVAPSDLRVQMDNTDLRLIPKLVNGQLTVEIYLKPAQELNFQLLDISVFSDKTELKGVVIDTSGSNFYDTYNLYPASNPNLTESDGTYKSRLSILSKADSVKVPANTAQGYYLGKVVMDYIGGDPALILSGQMDILDGVTSSIQTKNANHIYLGADGMGTVLPYSNSWPDLVVLQGTENNDFLPKLYPGYSLGSAFGDTANHVTITRGKIGQTNLLNYVNGNSVNGNYESLTGVLQAVDNKRILSFGYNGNDFLVSGDQNDTLLGGEGDDVLLSGLGADVYSGGNGFDTLFIDADGPQLNLDLSRIRSASDAVQLTRAESGQQSNTTPNTQGWTVLGIERFDISGSDLGDTIKGSQLDDRINAGQGTDHIYPGLGRNVIDGGKLDIYGRSGTTQLSSFELDSLYYDIGSGLSIDLTNSTIKARNQSVNLNDSFVNITGIVTNQESDWVTGRLQMRNTMPDGTTREVTNINESFVLLSLGGGNDVITLEPMGYQSASGGLRVSYDWSESEVNITFGKMSRVVPKLPADPSTTAPDRLVLQTQTALARYSQNGQTGTDVINGVIQFAGSSSNDFFDFSNAVYNQNGYYGNPEYRTSDSRVHFDNSDKGIGNDIVKGNGSTRLVFQGLSDPINISLANQTRPTTQIDLYYGSVVDPRMSSVQVETTSGLSSTISFQGVYAVFGGKGDDVLTGGSNTSWMGRNYYENGTELFSGGEGNNTITGGHGFDIITYSRASGPVNVQMWAGTATVTNAFDSTSPTRFPTDRFSGIENIEGTDYDDTYNAEDNGVDFALTPNGITQNQSWRGKYNLFEPLGGNDTIIGNGSTRLSYVSAMVAIQADLSVQDPATGMSNVAVRDSTQMHTVYDNVGWDLFSNVNSINASHFGDWLKGDGKSNTFRGNAGQDTIDGAGGIDTADYNNSPGPVVLIQQTAALPAGANAAAATTHWGTWTTARDGWGFSDVLSNIENINGSHFDDFIRVNGNTSHTVEGGRGNDTIERNIASGTSTTFVDYYDSPAGISLWMAGALGNDTLYGGTAFDGYLADGSSIVEKTGATTNLYLLSSKDRVHPTTIPNTPTTPTTPATTSNVPSGVVLSTDKLRNINAVVASMFDDYIVGGPTSDTFVPVAGFDTIDGGAGANFISFGETRYQIAFSTPLKGAFVDLNQAPNAGGFITATTGYENQTVQFKNVENFYGSRLDDTFIGNKNSNTLTGGNGNDSLFGGDGDDNFEGGQGDDLINGGGGFADRLVLPGSLNDYELGQEIGLDNLSYFTISRKVVQGVTAPDAGTDRITGVESFLFQGDGVTRTDRDLITNTREISGSMTYAGGKNLKMTPTLAVAKVGNVVETFDVGLLRLGTLQVADKNLTINPLTSLSPNTNYLLTLPSGVVKDTAGNSYAGTSFTFQTGPAGLDTTPPTLVTSNPAVGVGNVSLTDNLSLVFSEPIQKGTGKIELLSGSATGTVVESFDLSNTKRVTFTAGTLTIDPLTSLQSNTNYWLVVPSGAVKDFSGNAYAGTGNTFAFNTNSPADNILPTVTSISPNSNTTNIALDSNITVVYSENVLAGRIGSQVNLFQDSTLIDSFPSTSTRINFSGRTMTIDPSSSLQPGKNYRVEIETGFVKDLSNNLAAASAPVNFMTPTIQAGDDAMPLLVSTIPAASSAGSGLDANISLIFNEPINYGVGSITLRETNATDSAEMLSTSMKNNEVSFSMGNLGLMSGDVVRMTFPSASSKSGTYSVAQASTTHFSLIDFVPDGVFLGLLSNVNEMDNPIAYAAKMTTLTSTLINGKLDIKTGSTSYLQQANYKLDVVPTTPPKVTVEMTDVLRALALRQNSAMSTASYYEYVAADLDNSGKVDLLDIMGLLQMALMLPAAPKPNFRVLEQNYANATNANPLFSAFVKSGNQYARPEDMPTDPTQFDLTKSSATTALVGIWQGDVNGNFYG